MPIRLWSTVASHCHPPHSRRTVIGGASTMVPGTGAPGATTSAAMATFPRSSPLLVRCWPAARRAKRAPPPQRLLQALEVGGKRLDIGVAQIQVWHIVAGFDLLWVAQPALEVLRRIGQRIAGDALAAAKVREVRADLRLGGRAAQGMAGDAGAVGEELVALRDQRCLVRLARLRRSRWCRRGAEARLRRNAALLLHPGVERAGRLGDDDEAHQRVLQAAELGALAAIGAGLVGAQPHAVDAPGNDIGLAGQMRHPEAVNDVYRFELDLDRLADRNVELGGGDHP